MSAAGAASRRGASARAGFSLLELLIALLVFGTLIGAALGFLGAQNRAFQGGVDRMSALQTARFALQLLEDEIATAGTNVPGGQPALVLGDEDVLAFNADYATRVANDPFAVFHDPDAPTGQVGALSAGTLIPNSSVVYPDTVYRVGSALSPAETIIFYVSPDTSTARADDFALWRRVNAGAAELVARNLLQPQAAPFFRYLRESATGLDSVASAALPLVHSMPIHLAVADTGAAALIDSIRGVRVTLRATNGLSGDAERTVELTGVVRLPNVRSAMLEACGSAPILGQPLTATLGATATGEPQVTLTWAPATDEAGGEGDVMRYAIWRRVVPATSWEDPYLSIPAGQTSYTYADAAVTPGVVYQYGLAAQDCTPALSPIAASANVSIP